MVGPQAVSGFAIWSHDERLPLALSYGHAGVWEYELKTRRVRWSRELEALHGLAPGSFDGRHETVLSLIHPDDVNALVSAFRSAVEKRGELEHEFRAVWPDGSVHFLCSRGKMVCSEAGEPEWLVGITVDITERKHASEELQEKLRQLRLLSELAAAVSRAQEPDEIYRAAVQGLMDVVGADRASVLIRDADGVMRFRVWAGLSDEYRATTEGPTPWQPDSAGAEPIEVPDVMKNLWLSQFHPVFDKEGIGALLVIPLLGNGGVIGKFVLYYNQPHEFQAEELQVAQTIAMDVAFAAERQQSEKALRSSERRLSVALSAAQLGIWECDVRTGIIAVSGNYNALNGLSSERRSLTIDEWFGLVHPDDRGRVRTLMRAGLDQGGCWDAEFRVVWPDGSVHWLLGKGTVFFDDLGQPSHMAGVNLDITDLKRAEEQHLRLAAIVGSCEDAIFSKNLDGIIESWNAGAEKLFGYPADEIIGQPLSVLLPPDRLSEFPDILARIRAGAHLEHYEVTRMCKDGRRVDVSVTISPIKDSAGRLVGSSTIARDITDRRLADAALRQSEERFRFAQVAARIGTFDWNIKTGVITWTPELEAMYGLPPGDFLRTQAAWEALLHPSDRGRILQAVAESFKTGRSVEADWRIVWPDQSTHWITGRWQVFKDAAGEPLRMMGINVDISDRKRVEEALRQSEERFRLAIKATNDAIRDIDLETGVVAWNDTYSTLYGRPAETSDSWQWWIDRIHPDDREPTVRGLRSAISSDASSWMCEYRFRRASGAWADIYDRAYISRDSSGKAWRVIGAMQDLTDRKQAEANLRESEERFRRVFEEGPLGLALVGRDYRYLKVNGALCQMVGYSEAEMLGMSFADITHPDDLQADVALAERLFRREIPFYAMQKRFVRKSGETIWINLTATVIADSGGELLYGLGMVENITEVKRAQEEALARQKLESVGTLASGIAHDFNNLLGAVQAQGELALAELDAGSTCKEELKVICDVAKRGSEIVRQLMIYAGKESEIVERIDLSKIVEEMLALLRVSVSKHAVVHADLGQDLPPASATAAQVRQIVMNLITNASDAIGDRDGVIRVITKRVSLRAESVRESDSSSEGDYVVLEVSDNGCGMSWETRERLFDPFFTTKSAGRGLGLAVVSGIVRSLGGSIRVTSELGKGSTFLILLPSAETRISTMSDRLPTIERLPGPSQQATVLIVEDEEVLRQAVAKTLRKNGFEVFEAADGSFAIDLLRTNGGRIDAILLDMTIPGASSREVVAEAVKVRSDISVVLASAYSQEMFSAATSVPQIKRFIRKPFQLADLVKTLRSAMAA